MGKGGRAVGQWGLVAIFLLILFYFGDLSELSRMPSIHWTSIFLLFLSMVGFTLIHNVRWMAIVKSITNRSPEKKNSFFQLYQWLLNSYALGTILPSDISLAGLRTFYMNRSQVLVFSAALFSVLLDRFFDFIVFFALAIPSALFMTGVANGMETLFYFGCILAVIFLFIFWKKGEGLDFLMRNYRSIMDGLSKLPMIGKRIGSKWIETSDKPSFKGGSVQQLMGWSFLKYFLMVLRFYFTGQALGINFSFLQGFFYMPFIQLFMILNLTPGGLGVVELGSYGALKFMGVPESKIMVFVVGQRIIIGCMTITLALMSQLFFALQTRMRKVEIQ